MSNSVDSVLSTEPSPSLNTDRFTHQPAGSDSAWQGVEKGVELGWIVCLALTRAKAAQALFGSQLELSVIWFIRAIQTFLV